MTSSRGRASRRRCFGFFLLSIAVLLGAPALVIPCAFAQENTPTPQALETARNLYKEGKELRSKGDLAGALEKFQAAHALGNTPVTGIELARTYASLGRWVEAREVCLYVGRTAVAPDETGKSADARVEAAKLAEELQPRIPSIVVKVVGITEGEVAHLAIDDVGVPDAALSEPQKVDPGTHTARITVSRGPSTRQFQQTAEAIEGQTVEAVIAIPALVVPPVAAAPLYVSPPHRSWPWTAKVGLGTALVGVAAGLIAGSVALADKGDLSGECNAAKQCANASQGASDLASAHVWAGISTAAFAVAGAGAVLGIVGALTRHSSPGTPTTATFSPWVSVGSAGIYGTF